VSQLNDLVSQHDDQLVKDYGVILAVEMIQRITTEGDIRGVHFCTLNLEKSVQRVLEILQWTGVTAPVHNKLIAVGPSALNTMVPPPCSIIVH
jgi:methylenetetrahydrofolate reductase (NADPH)